MKASQSLFERMGGATPVREFDYSLLRMAIELACAETPTAQIANSGQQLPPHRQKHNETDRLVKRLTNSFDRVVGGDEDAGSFNHYTAEWRR
jgi:hypothetical protein